MPNYKTSTHEILVGYEYSYVWVGHTKSSIESQSELYHCCAYLYNTSTQILSHVVWGCIGLHGVSSLPSWTKAIPALLMRRWRGKLFCLYSSVNLFTDCRDAKSRDMNSTVMDLSGCSRDTSSVMRVMAWGEEQWMYTTEVWNVGAFTILLLSDGTRAVYVCR